MADDVTRLVEAARALKDHALAYCDYHAEKFYDGDDSKVGGIQAIRRLAVDLDETIAALSTPATCACQHQAADGSLDCKERAVLCETHGGHDACAMDLMRAQEAAIQASAVRKVESQLVNWYTDICDPADTGRSAREAVKRFAFLLLREHAPEEVKP